MSERAPFKLALDQVLGGTEFLSPRGAGIPGAGVPKVRVYDFRRPDKFSKEQMRTAEMLYGHFARLVTGFLAGYLRSLVQISVVSVEQNTYGEFIGRVGSPGIIAIVGLSPLPGKVLMVMDPVVAFYMIDRLFGGPGRMIGKARSLTEIEQTVMERIFGAMLNYLAETWRNFAEITPKLEAIEANPLFAQIVAPNEMVLVVVLQINIGEQSGTFSFCHPYLTLEPVLPKLSAQQWFQTLRGQESASIARSEMEEFMEGIPLELKISLGGAVLTMRELLNLEVGDVVSLGTVVGGDLEIFVGDRLKFRAQAGLLGRNLGCKITGVVEEERADV